MTASRSTQTSTSGGSSETEVKEFAVMPCGLSPPTVTTVTPVAKAPNARRSSSVSVVVDRAASGATCTLVLLAPSALR